MAEKIISPGVFTQERDLSYLPQGIGEIGAAIVGPTTKGPAFAPTIITSFQEFIDRFGDLTDTTYVPFTVKEYLKNAGSVTIIRVMTSEPWQILNTVSTGYGYGIELTQLTGSKATAAATITTATSVTYYFTSSAGTIFNFTSGSSNALSSGTSYTYVGGATPTEVVAGLGSVFNTYSTTFGVTANSASAVLQLTASSFGDEVRSFQSASTQTSLTGGTYVTASGATPVLVAHLIPNSNGGTGTSVLFAVTASGARTNTIKGSEFVLSSSYGTASVSLSSTSANNLGVVFGLDPYSTAPNVLANNYYLYRYWADTANSYASTYSASIVSLPLKFNTRAAYSYGVTPVITSQLVSGIAYDLFQVARRSDGNDSNYDVKITIEDVKKAGTIPGSDYGSFNLFVRRVGGFLGSNDTDQRPEVLESWINLNLDPNSPNYIVRRIGDMYMTIDSDGVVSTNGDYKNLSKYIYIIPDASLPTYPVTLVPYGFEAIYAPVSSSHTPVISYVTSQGTANNYDKRVEFGFDFYNDDATQYLWSVDDYGINISVGSNFSLDNMFSHPSSSGVKGTDGSTFTPGTSLSASNAPTQMLKFAVPFQGGHNGMPYNRVKNTGGDISAGNVYGFDCTTSTSSGSAAYIKALNILTNAEDYDMNLLATPGIISSLHSSITDKAIEIVEDRGDAFYIMDTVQLSDNITTAINNNANFNTNYAGTYYPWVKVLDTSVNKLVWVPPSTVLPGVIANNDKLAYEWYAPAGLNRGGLPGVYSTYFKLSQGNRDDLYINRINPIASFPGQGVCVWGQKTLQSKPSALDRINVRRLLIKLKKYIASATRYLVFEQNTVATRTAFQNIVNPYLEQVKQRQGLYVFKVVMDETNNTPDLVDRNIMYGQIYLQPTKTAEFILLDFNIQPTGATFAG